MLLITYEIFDKTRDATALNEAIKSLGAWWHHLGAIWLVDSNKTPNEAYNSLVEHLYKSDHILIIEVKNSYKGWLPKEAWNWLYEKNF